MVFFDLLSVFHRFFFKFSSCRSVFFVYRTSYKLFSSSPIKFVEAVSFLPLNLDLTLPDFQKDRLDLVNAVRGLMCFRVGFALQRGMQREIRREIRIINFTTKQVLSLPLRKPNMFFENDSSKWDYESMWNYFWYDPLSDEYKVVSTISSFNSMRTRRVRSETQVLVLGAGASWRNTKSNTSPPPHHRPHGKGIIINNVLYYAAWSHEDIYVLMSFDLNSEEFNLIEFPIEEHTKWNNRFHKVNFMNYKDQVALLDESRLNTQYILDFWVLEDVGKSKWSLKFVVLPCQHLRLTLGDGDSYLGIRGTSRSGEITLYGMNKYVFYNLERNSIIRGVVITPSVDITEMSLWDDVESIMFLEA